MEEWQRTVSCGELGLSDVGRTVTVNGWANVVRDHGSLVFIDLRDRTGLIQLRADAERSGDLINAATAVRPEFVLSARGEVRARAEKDINPKHPTGAIEIDLTHIEMLNACRQPLPFQVSDEAQMALVNEELRVKYRYLDLRRPSMQKMLALRHQVIRTMRAYLDERGFTEIETPIMTRSTPEGARDYLVPYRLNPGMFYALPQSPQQYKQLLMVAGCERYYQIARCFRDESQRADRQPEFSQLDIEMSFTTQEDVLELAEGLWIEVVERHCNKRLGAKPFTRLSYDEALRRFGTDKPDLRFGLELVDLAEPLRDTAFGVFQSALNSGGQVKAVRYPGGASLSRKETDDLGIVAREMGAKGMAWFVVEAAGSGDPAVQSYTAGHLQVRSPIAKHLAQTEVLEILAATEAQAGDLVLFVADKPAVVAAALGRLRSEIGRRLALADPNVLHFAWILDFPLVEWSESEQRWDAVHHMFTMPHADDLPLLDSDPGRVRALCYDIVCNGYESASGSIRIHRPDIQAKVFDLLKIPADIQQERFGHMLEAFSYGAPPHGGIAPGIDRLIMLMLDQQNIREVLAFPKMGGGADPMMGAPGPVDALQMKELGLQVLPKPHS